MFFVTEMDSDAYLGCLLINAKSKNQYFTRIKKEIVQKFGENKVKFITLGELYDILGNDDSKATIFLSKYTEPYQKALLTRYPSAKITAYEFDEKNPIQPSPIFWEK
jgi:hypothetical protein